MQKILLYNKNTGGDNMSVTINKNADFSKCYHFVDSRPEKFYAVPKFFSKPAYKKISVYGKLLYSIMLDRVSLSAKNKLYNDEGFVYIFYTIDETMDFLNCSRNTAIKVHKELEKYGLIQKTESSGFHPSKIYVNMYVGEY